MVLHMKESQSAVTASPTYVSDIEIPTSHFLLPTGSDEAEKTVHFESIFPHHRRLAKRGVHAALSLRVGTGPPICEVAAMERWLA
jgi:hypothetical protein